MWDSSASARWALRSPIDGNVARARSQSGGGGTVSEQVAAKVAVSRTLRIYVEMSTIGSAPMARIAQSLAVGSITLWAIRSAADRRARAGTRR